MHLDLRGSLGLGLGLGAQVTTSQEGAAMERARGVKVHPIHGLNVNPLLMQRTNGNSKPVHDINAIITAAINVNASRFRVLMSV